MDGQRLVLVLALTRFCCRWYQTVVARYRTKATWKPLGSAATAAAPTAYSVAWCAIACVSARVYVIRAKCIHCILPMVLLYLLVLQTASFKVSQYSFDFVRIPLQSLFLPPTLCLCLSFSLHHSSVSPEIIWFFLCRCAPSTPIKCITIWSVRRFLITFWLTLSFFHSLFLPFALHVHLSLFRFICVALAIQTRTLKIVRNA